MNEDWQAVGEFPDGSGKRIQVARAEDRARIAVLSPAGIVLTAIVLDGTAREAFDWCWQLASWQADAFAEEAAMAVSAP